MKLKTGIGVVFLVASLAFAPAAMAKTKMTECRMKFGLEGWSAIVKVAHGVGRITCDNGQHAVVAIEAKGVGLTAGKAEIRNGVGRFSDATSIDELFGTYVAATANAGAVKSAGATAMTKGEVSLALSGTGRGVDLGVAVEKFTIKRR